MNAQRMRSCLFSPGLPSPTMIDLEILCQIIQALWKWSTPAESPPQGRGPPGVALPLHLTIWRQLPMPQCKTWISDACGLGPTERLSREKMLSSVPPPFSHTCPSSIPGRQHGRARAAANVLCLLQTGHHSPFYWYYLSIDVVRLSVV